MSRIISVFNAPSHAALYAKFRPKTPAIILNRMLDFLKVEINPPFKLAIDVGCGSGQSTELLAPHFKEVHGIDISEAQVLQAQKQNTNSNVTYKVGTSTTIPEGNNAVQLITASQCHHWLDLVAFYEEAQRILDPKGVISLYWYQMPLPSYQDKTEALQKLFTHVIFNIRM